MPQPSAPANRVPPTEATLIRRIEALERAQREALPAVMDAIAPMFADINQAIADLAAQQAQIVQLFNTAVTFLADFVDVNGPMTVGTTEGPVTSYSFTVPAGFTRALVVGYGSIGLTNPTGGTASLAGRVYIDSPAGTVFGPRRFQSATAGQDAAGYPYKQTVISGLHGGETVTVRLAASVWPAVWTNAGGGASLNVQAYFSRS